MHKNLIALLVGISSSLLATAILLAVSEFARRVFLPWYADHLYRGVRIDGEWELSDLGGKAINTSPHTMALNLVQRGERISGTYFHKNPDTTDIYELTGTLRDSYFLATAVPRSNRHMDGISMLLSLRNRDGRLLLVGQVLSCNTPGDVFASPELTFRWREP